MLNIVIFGPPGSGKGTQAERLIGKYNLMHISTGELLRSEVAAQTELGMQAKSIMDKGELVSDEIVIGMIENMIEEHHDKPGFIFDGFPRTVDQSMALRKVLNAKGTSVKMLINLLVDHEELMKRLLKRGEEMGRGDDNVETINNRIEVYEKQTKPVTHYYEGRNLHFPVEGVGNVDDIFGRIVDVVENNK